MRARLTLFLIVAPVVLWVLFGTLGDRAASKISSRFGSRILAGGDGKFAEAAPFVKRRLDDAVVLATAACLLGLAHRRLAVLASRRLRPPGLWIVQGWSVFVCLNVFAAVAARTVLFWCLLYTGKQHVNNFTQWHIKQGMMAEIEAPSQAVLLGASQTRSQIDAKVLNERLGRKIWTTELHFPGSSCYDMILCLERIPKVHLDYAITYLSEGSFYSESGSGRLMYFFGFRDLPGYWALGPGRPEFDHYSVCGLLGDVFPLYRVWEPLTDRVRGWKLEDQEQARYDASLESDLESRARRVAKGYSLGPASRFQQRAFAEFCKLCRARGCRLIICCGHFSPILGRVLDPALRADMMAFLREQAAQDPNLVLLDESQLPPQSEGDYDDLAHVNLAARARFSQYIAGVLEQLASAKPPQSPDKVQQPLAKQTPPLLRARTP